MSIHDSSDCFRHSDHKLNANNFSLKKKDSFVLILKLRLINRLSGMCEFDLNMIDIMLVTLAISPLPWPHSQNLYYGTQNSMGGHSLAGTASHAGTDISLVIVCPSHLVHSPKQTTIIMYSYVLQIIDLIKVLERIVDDAEMKEWIQSTISFADLKSCRSGRLILFVKFKEKFMEKHWDYIQDKVSRCELYN